MFGTYRTLLALMVVATHLGGVPDIGAYAVFGFYVLSGYLMTLIMQKDYGYSIAGIYKYGVNRFLRIYPIYWVSIGISVILILLVGGARMSEYQEFIYMPSTLKQYLKNILLVLRIWDSPRLTPPAWALTVEIFYYILIGLGISRKSIVLPWLAFGVVYHSICVIYGLGVDYRYFSVMAASLPFATGAVIFHYKDEFLHRLNSLRGKQRDFLPLFGVFLFFLNWTVGVVFEWMGLLCFYINYVICAFIVVLLTEPNRLGYIPKKFDKFMGDFSYPIYLIHYQVGFVALLLLEFLGIELGRPSYILMFVSIPLIFLVSWLITVSLERPIEVLRAQIKTR